MGFKGFEEPKEIILVKDVMCINIQVWAHKSKKQRKLSKQDVR